MSCHANKLQGFLIIARRVLQYTPFRQRFDAFTRRSLPRNALGLVLAALSQRYSSFLPGLRRPKATYQGKRSWAWESENSHGGTIQAVRCLATWLNLERSV